MSQALAPAQGTTVETKWTVLNGAMAGAVRLITSTAFTIGRSPECEFVLINDPKCSRKHAEVRWTGTSCEIMSLNEKNLILVNGKEVTHAPLQDGDVITLGTTEVQFNMTRMATEADISHRQITRTTGGTKSNTSLSVIRGGAAAAAPYQAPQRMPGRASTRPRPKPKAGGSQRLLIYGVVALVIGFFVFDNSAKKKKEYALRTEQQIQADIDTANKLQEAALNAPNRLDQSVPARQAQENFVRGFRDYRKGQFERSLDSFQACLALDPKHVLCNRYIRLAQRRFNELVQYNIVLGRKYRDQNQFKACRASFRNVMVMVKDANNPAYREARANYDFCNTSAEGHY